MDRFIMTCLIFLLSELMLFVCERETSHPSQETVSKTVFTILTVCVNIAWSYNQWFQLLFLHPFLCLMLLLLFAINQQNHLTFCQTKYRNKIKRRSLLDSLLQEMSIVSRTIRASSSFIIILPPMSSISQLQSKE